MQPILQGAKSLFRIGEQSAAGAAAAAEAPAGPGEERVEGSNEPSAVEACSSAASGGVAKSPQDQIQCPVPTIKRTTSLGSSSSGPSINPDPFPRSSSEVRSRKKSTVMWQRAMRKSASEVQTPLPATSAGVGLGSSASEGWLDEAAAGPSRHGVAAPHTPQPPAPVSPTLASWVPHTEPPSLPSPHRSTPIGACFRLSAPSTPHSTPHCTPHSTPHSTPRDALARGKGSERGRREDPFPDPTSDSPTQVHRGGRRKCRGRPGARQRAIGAAGQL